ncbi:MAG: Ribosomal RNA small subunit methyltransferase H [Candidatus Anoxychlamydiales bacterium]|nr:Ribosomal RNA small subunit methyltransferase H [Candidatus Anoxychlamydiales bacterium]
MQKIKHFPVLLKECLSFFKDVNLNTFFDGTVGAAGHAKAILDEHDEIEIYIGNDRDKDALEIANDTLKPYMNKVRLVHSNYSNIDEILGDMNIKKVDGVLLDLGLSSMQLDSESRGFSFRYDSVLDMRMNKSQDLMAKDIVNKYSEKELYKIFKEYGEDRRSKVAAKEIVIQRKKKKINTTFDLLEVLMPVLNKNQRIHPATRLFQALRICVNDELGELKKGLSSAINRLNIDGVIGVISFHSLEDRIVKHTFKDNKNLKVLTKKPIIASRGERNPRARSAKLRFAKRVDNE